MRSKSVIAETCSSEGGDPLSPLIEQLWHELDGQVPEARIRQVATRVAAKFNSATVATNIPLFVRHLTREWLKEELKGRNVLV